MADESWHVSYNACSVGVHILNVRLNVQRAAGTQVRRQVLDEWCGDYSVWARARGAVKEVVWWGRGGHRRFS